MTLDPIHKMTENVKTIRDSKRPAMEDVIRVLDRFFDGLRDRADIRNVARGPETWSWADMSMSHYGFEKWFIVTGSTMEGTEGHPLLTIRQSTAPRLDAWVTVSSLVIGPSDIEIEASLALALANQAGAFEGLRQAVTQVVEAMSGEVPDLGQIAQEMADLVEDGKKDVN